MSEQQIQTTSTPNAPPTANVGNEFKKLIPTVVLAILTAFATSWWNSQKSQSELQFRLEAIEQKGETNAKNIANNSGILQQNAIRIAEMGIVQNNLLEQIKELKQQQMEIKLTLNRK